MKVVFMGTPAFAVPSLDVLFNSAHKILACVTAPDRPAGRGRKLSVSEVKQYCLEHNIKVLQPEKLKDESFVDELKSLSADVFIVVAFRMLPEIIWSMPKNGTINLHASLLPDYRGAAPINWALINGEKKSGLTTFYIASKIDTGDILLQKEIDIDEKDNFGSLHDKMMYAGGKLLLQTINNIENIKPKKQILSQGNEKTAPKLNRENTAIDWNKSDFQIHNHIRGLSPYPGAWTEMIMNGEKILVKILESEIADMIIQDKPGTFKQISKKELVVNCGRGAIKIIRAQIQGKKAMNMDEILRGYSENFLAGVFNK